MLKRGTAVQLRVLPALQICNTSSSSSDALAAKRRRWCMLQTPRPRKEEVEGCAAGNEGKRGESAMFPLDHSLSKRATAAFLGPQEASRLQK
jgi:hypothetical protein